MLAQFAPQQEDNERKRRTKYAEVERTGVSTRVGRCVSSVCVAWDEPLLSQNGVHIGQPNSTTKDIRKCKGISSCKFLLTIHRVVGPSLGTSERDLRSFPDHRSLGTEKNQPPHPELLCLILSIRMPRRLWPKKSVIDEAAAVRFEE